MEDNFDLDKQNDHDQFKTILLVINNLKQSMEQNTKQDIKQLEILARKIEDKVVKRNNTT